MIRVVNVLLTISAVGTLVGVYALKYSVEETAASKATLERTIERQEAELSLLKADWAYLNQPAHVAPIAERHTDVLGLQLAVPEQFRGFGGLPMRLPPPNTQALDELFESLAEGVDPADQSLEEQQ